MNRNGYIRDKVMVASIMENTLDWVVLGSVEKMYRSPSKQSRSGGE